MEQKKLFPKLLADKPLFNGLSKKVSDDIVDNLNPKFPLRPYQKKAIARFTHYLIECTDDKKPIHILFNMATGSGKTLIMAACILDLYTRGYRNILFFVNRSNIITKTEENFLNVNSIKYLFSMRIFLEKKEVKIRKVNNFQESRPNRINILFTTIQGLHSSLKNPSENSITLNDFAEGKVVLISDEAHHINALTRSLGALNQTEQEIRSTWEGTVADILQSNKENIMLEFTATIDLKHPNIYAKYKDKIIYQYSLKHYRFQKYSKEIQLFQSPLENLDRALQAVILSQYRLKIAEKYGLQIKPVILMKSRFIKESRAFREDFFTLIKSLNKQKLEEIREKTDIPLFNKIFKYFADNGITLENLCTELKEDFSPQKCLSVNSKEESVDNQILVNTLESPDNPIRLIFAVDKLNEGWDVLNLFDIVRLYEIQNPRSTITISEAQLIGRGARYCPFQIDLSQELYKRKYDNNSNNELRILEELHYHSTRNLGYIRELRKILIQIGICDEEEYKKELKIKDSFKNHNLWKEEFIFLNKQINNDRSHIKSFYNLDITKLQFYSLRTGLSSVVTPFESSKESVKIKYATKKFNLREFGTSIIRKAINKIEMYEFATLKQYLPYLTSITEFIESDEYLGMIDVEVRVGDDPSILDELSPRQKLNIAYSVLENIKEEIKSGDLNYGTEGFLGSKISLKFTNKELNFTLSPNSNREYGIGMRETKNKKLFLDLTSKDWYAFDENYGTDQEKYFVKFIDSIIGKLRTDFTDIVVFRNADHFQIYNFSNGIAFEPDFVLFLREKKKTNPALYQIFVEPKGKHLLEKDKWKEDFLLDIENNCELQARFKKENIKVIGLPFYNEEKELKEKFIKALYEKIY